MLRVSSILIGLTLFFVLGAQAQSYYWEDPPRKRWFKSIMLEGGLGYTNYYGDVQDRGQIGGISLGYGGSAIANINQRFSASLGYHRGNFRGQRDFHSSVRGPETVNGTIRHHFMGQVQFHFVPYHHFRKRGFKALSYWTKFNAYGAVGGGYIMYTSAVASSGDRPNPRGTTKAGISVPYTVGARFRFDQRYSLGLELTYAMLFTDELDATPRPGTRSDTYSLFMLRFGYSFRKIRLRF